MNIQTKQMNFQKKQIKEHSDWGFYCRLIIKLILLLLAVFAVANSYIYLNQQIQTIERDNASVSRKIENIDRELKSLQNRYESASSRTMIDKQIAKFNLQLREPDHTQIKIITLHDDKNNDTMISKADYKYDRQDSANNTGRNIAAIRKSARNND